MAFGGLLDTLTPSVDVADGWGGTIAMTHRAWSITISLVPEFPQPMTPDPVVATVQGVIGKVIGGTEFRANKDVPSLRATFTVTEVKALGNGLTLVALLAAAKTKLGVT